MRTFAALQRWLIFVLTAALLTLGVQNVSHGQGGKKIYWTEWNRDTRTWHIRRAHLDGSYVKDIVTGLKDPKAIALDTIRRKLYWTDQGTGKIQRADLTGRNIKDIATGFKLPGGEGRIHIRCDENGCEGVAFPRNGGKIELPHALLIDPRSLALDAGNGRIYWGNHLLDTIQSATLDGSSLKDVCHIRRILPESFTIAVGGDKIYWSNVDWKAKAGKIQRANLDGSTIEDIITGLRGPHSIALDLIARKIYWISDGNKIQRANLNGSHVEHLVTGSIDYNTLALDLAAGKMYWTAWDPNTDTGKIQRANLDGSRVKDVITGLGYPWGIALEISGAYAVNHDVDKLTTIWAKVKVE